jgi:Fe2+ transport system protein FeoA
MTSLRTLNTNQTAIIETVIGENNHAMRLLALGFTPGSEVSLFKGSILGGPRVFSVQGSRIALRDYDAALIHVSVN